ncbi:universal stress protein [Natrarchaeobaculum aegyptiacum]|uniref:Universal stress protein n=1 Tax=Natrarchaeobaculum aegyptiacum TaxID=745377 RepID=A0A2Z2I2E8_9EURY|nr:universal stress protein [Natrarchaeobaculum aegyptiacum]ARS90988.1 universal stress protein [Natrarchaeobaculum aegyptiacum]
MTDTVIDSILIPTDGSEGASTGAKRGLEVADALEATVTVLSVADASALEGAAGVLESNVESHRDALEESARSAAGDVESVAADRFPDLEVRVETERGTPAQVVSEYVDEVDADLVAMGTSGRSGLERALLGSVTEAVLRTVSVPVLAVPPSATERSLSRDAVEDVLLPTDDSEGALAAVDVGLDLADEYDALVHAVYAVDTRRLRGASVATGAVDPSDLLSDLERAGDEALEVVRERARERGVSVAGRLASGSAAEAILEAADETGSDLVVMGTHGRSGLERQLIGSVTESVVRGAEVPVCCVPIEG